MKEVCGIWIPDSDDHLEAHLRASPLFEGKGTYQMKKINLALAQCERLRKMGNAIDIGAHCGLWTRVLAHKFKMVVAFEPLPVHVECWHKNTAGLTNVHLVPAALDERAGDLLLDPIPGNTGNAHVVNEMATIGNPRLSVGVTAERLDAFKLAQLNKIDFIKIDCEGWELPIVKGAERTIKSNKPVMVIEQKPGNGSRYGWHDRAAVDLVLTWGAQIAWEKAGDYCLYWR